MADRLASLVLDGLTRAAQASAGLPLFTTKKTVGVFPASALGRQAAQLAQEQGWLASSPADTTRIALTEAGYAHLVEQACPKRLFDAVASALTARESQVETLIKEAHALKSEWANLLGLWNGTVSRLERLRNPTPAMDRDDLRDALAGWRSASDCPLPELYRRLRVQQPALTIGQFHDEIRRRHDRGEVYLHPWTGPLYTLPEPALALLVGHEVAYYASLRMPVAA